MVLIPLFLGLGFELRVGFEPLAPRPVLIPLFLGLGFERPVVTPLRTRPKVLIPLFLGLGFEQIVLGNAVYGIRLNPLVFGSWV